VPSVHISLKSQASAFLDWNTEIMGRTIGDPSTSFCLSSCEPALSSSPRSPEFHPECCSSHSLALPLSLTTSCRISCGGQVPREGGGTFHDKASEVWLLDTVKQNMSLADHSLPPKSWSRSSDPSAGYASAAQTATAVKPESLERPTTAGNTPEWRQPSSQIGDPWIGRDNRAPQAQLFRASRGVSHAESQQFGSPVTSPTVQGDVSRILLTDMPSVSTSWTHCDNEDGLSTYSSYADQNAYGSSHASISRPIMSSILPTTPTPANSLAAIVDPTDIDQEHPLIVTIGSSSGLHIGPSEPAISREPVVPYKNDKNRTGRDPPGNRPANSIPSIFRILVEQLECLHASGIRRVPRTTLAVALTKQDKMIYEKAGVTTFRKYVSLAGKAGIVQLEADETGSSWISLHADWHRIPTES
jgi:hypothetical protein